MTLTPAEHRHGPGDLAIADTPAFGRIVYCVVCGERFMPVTSLEEFAAKLPPKIKSQFAEITPS